MKKHLSNIILVLIFITGLSLLLYPTVSNYWNSIHQSRTISSYSNAVRDLDDKKYQEILESARAYNAKLFSENGGLALSEDKIEEYNSELKVEGTDVMSYITIDKIDVSLPIYHGTDEETLQVAVGHINGSSLPVGGESTHCVLSGHRGLPSAVLFSDLDRLEVGDTFVLHTLDETLTYEVDKISIVEPTDVDNLQIVEGEDLCTLVTCTPYGVNSHRLLVRGHRVPNEQTSVRVTSEAVQIEPIQIAPFFAALLIILIMIPALIRSRKNRRGE